MKLNKKQIAVYTTEVKSRRKNKPFFKIKIKEN